MDQYFYSYFYRFFSLYYLFATLYDTVNTFQVNFEESISGGVDFHCPDLYIEGVNSIKQSHEFDSARFSFTRRNSLPSRRDSICLAFFLSPLACAATLILSLYYLLSVECGFNQTI